MNLNLLKQLSEAPGVPGREERVRAILERSGKVLAAFHGHDHAGNHKVINGIHYYTLIAVIEGSGEANNAYALVEVQPDLTIAVTGFRRAVSIQMSKNA